MTEAAIIGVGMHPWGKFPEKDIEEMCVHSVLEAMKDAKVKWRDIQAVVAGCWPWSGTGSPGMMMGHRISRRLGEKGIPVINAYAACATPISIVHIANSFIASGEYDLILVTAMDKSPKGFFRAESVEPMESYTLRLKMVGATNPTYWALSCRRRMEEVGTTERHLALVKEKNSKHGALNPYARYRKVFTVEDVLNSPIVSDPLRLYEICATSDGAASVILCNEEKAKKYTDKPVRIAASAVATADFYDKEMHLPYLCSPANPKAPSYSQVHNAVKTAYKKSGLGPDDIDFIELHDTCTFLELLYSEIILGLEEGEGDKLLEKGETTINGRIPINPSGGVASLGEAVSAQGLAQIHEIVLQLRGQAGERQVKNAKIGLSQVYGGWGSAAVCILEKSF